MRDEQANRSSVLIDYVSIAAATAALLVAVLLGLSELDGRSFPRLLYVGGAAVLGAICWSALVWILRARGAPGGHAHSAPPAAAPHADSSFSVVIPGGCDAAALEATVAHVLATERGPVRLRVAVAARDARARAVARRVADRHADIVEVVRRPPHEARRRRDRLIVHVERLRPATQRPRVRLGLLGAPLFAGVGAWLAAQTHAASFLYLWYLAVSLAVGAVCWSTLVWMLHAWRTPERLTESGRTGPDLDPAHSFSLIVPARHEEAVLEATLSRLVTTDHPAFEVLVVVGNDDPATRDVATRVAERHPELVKVVVDHSDPKNKPKALNSALPHCTGDITGVFDAEDDVHPRLLQRVDQCFQTSHADVVQAGVQLMNFRSSWLTVRNVLEYYFWFRSRLHFHARQGFIPLGGNTVFVRTQILRAVEGWDPECLAEDCELGVRLSALGAKTVVFYDAELVTREECPPTLRAFTRQRTRWNQGYLQTMAKGYWRRLPLRQRAFGAYILAIPYVMALSWVLTPVAVATAVALKAPVGVTLISFLPALPMMSILAVEVAGLGDFCRVYGERPSIRDYARLVIGLPVYQAVLAFAAARAVVREAQGARGWEKTAHLGLHLAAAPDHAGPPSDGVLGRAGSAPAPATSRGVSAVALRADPVVDHAAMRPRAVELARPRRARGSEIRNIGVNGGSRPIEELFGAVRGEPLWVRLHARSANGSAALSLPGFVPGGVKTGGRRLEDVRALVRAAIAARADVAVQVLVLAVVGTVHAVNMLHWPAALFDEGTYVANAWAVQHGALAPYTFSYGHPPLAWLAIFVWSSASSLLGLGSSYSIDNGRELMLVVSIVSGALLYSIARRLGMAKGFAAVAVLLFGLSPVALFFHRAVLLDNLAVAWALAAFFLALTPRRRLWAFAGSGACFAVSVLSKETILVILPALLLAAAQNADRRTRRYCVTLFIAFLTVIGLAFPLYAALKGELLPGSGHVSLYGSVIVQLFTRAATGSVFDAHSTTHATVMSWLTLDPWLVGAALVLSPFALARRSTRAVTLAYVIQVAMILRPGYLPGMYVLGLLPFAALIVAGGCETLWRSLRRSRRSWTSAWSRPAALGAAAFVALWVTPSWTHGARVATTIAADGPPRAAERWLVDHIDHRRRIIVDDQYWIHLIEHGFDARPVQGGFFSRTVVSYWPLDYDPAVRRRFPRAWREFDYIVSTEPMRATKARTPTAAAALDHSRVVVSFGRGAHRIEVRAIIAPHRPG